MTGVSWASQATGLLAYSLRVHMAKDRNWSVELGPRVKASACSWKVFNLLEKVSACVLASTWRDPGDFFCFPYLGSSIPDDVPPSVGRSSRENNWPCSLGERDGVTWVSSCKVKRTVLDSRTGEWAAVQKDAVADSCLKWSMCSFSAFRLIDVQG